MTACAPDPVIVTARAATPDFDFVSRFFAPSHGIDEDPVTGDDPRLKTHLGIRDRGRIAWATTSMSAPAARPVPTPGSGTGLTQIGELVARSWIASGGNVGTKPWS